MAVAYKQNQDQNNGLQELKNAIRVSHHRS